MRAEINLCISGHVYRRSRMNADIDYLCSHSIEIAKLNTTTHLELCLINGQVFKLCSGERNNEPNRSPVN